MKKINKKAFTLAEALVVMFIIGIVALAALHNMTKKAPLRPDEAHHGQYACWYDPDRSQVCEQGAVGRRVDSPRCIGTCTFTPDRKIAAYTIYIVGAGVKKGVTNIQGQFVSGSFGGADFKEDVTITLGGTTSTRAGTSFGDREDLFAKNGRIGITNGLVMDNIKSCRIESIIPAGSRCVTEFKEHYTVGENIIASTGTPQSCSIAESGVRIGQQGKTIRLDGCRALVDIEQDPLATADTGNTMRATEIEAMIKTNNLRFVGDREKREYKYEGSIEDKYTESTNPNINTKYKISVQLWDSDYTIPTDPAMPAIPANPANPTNPVNPTESKMSLLLDPNVLPKFRISEITNKLHELEPGVGDGKGKYGAVFIMW